MTVAMPIVTLQSMFTVGFGFVRLPVERLDQVVNGMVAVFNLAGPTVTLLMAFIFAVLQQRMIAQWPGKESQLSFKAVVTRILCMPALQFIVFLAEIRAVVLCIIYGSAGQSGPLQYRARKKVGAVGPEKTLPVMACKFGAVHQPGSVCSDVQDVQDVLEF